ncbi:hypothetical protein J6590_067455 [Homalodisca vitripennis]|nr:hypothetical protein J6590_067455 [Homalodisca vitripennis]
MMTKLDYWVRLIMVLAMITYQIRLTLSQIIFGGISLKHKKPPFVKNAHLLSAVQVKGPSVCICDNTFVTFCRLLQYAAVSVYLFKQFGEENLLGPMDTRVSFSTVRRTEEESSACSDQINDTMERCQLSLNTKLTVKSIFVVYILNISCGLAPFRNKSYRLHGLEPPLRNCAVDVSFPSPPLNPPPPQRDRQDTSHFT